jgi:protein phosphatase
MSRAAGDRTVQIVGRSHPGRVRSRNEDSVAWDDALGIAVLADGMGGLAEGHVASREAVRHVLADLQGAVAAQPATADLSTLEAAIAGANDHVRELAGRQGTLMGTTAVAMVLSPEGACRVAHVGDSRAYRFHTGELVAMTRDHSVVQDMVDRGLLQPQMARHSPHRNVITRAVGLEPEVQIDSVEVRLAADDLVLLCSDGLWDMLDDGAIRDVLAACGPGRNGLAEGVDALIDAANAAGGSDNVTVVLARISRSGR